MSEFACRASFLGTLRLTFSLGLSMSKALGVSKREASLPTVYAAAWPFMMNSERQTPFLVFCLVSLLLLVSRNLANIQFQILSSSSAWAWYTHFLDPLSATCYVTFIVVINLFTLLDVCVSSLRRGHANLLCIVPMSRDDPRRGSPLSATCYVMFIVVFV